MVTPQRGGPRCNKLQPLHVEEARSGGNESISEVPKVEVTGFEEFLDIFRNSVRMHLFTNSIIAACDLLVRRRKIS